LKALILSTPKPDRLEFDTQRFAALAATLNRGGISARHCFVNSTEQLLELLNTERPDIVYSADYFIYDADKRQTNIHQTLKELRIPFIGSDPAALDLVLSKSALKKVWKQQNVPTPAYFVLKKGENEKATLEAVIQTADYPYILKPNKEGNSRGLDESSIVFD
jgi:D-alanine-D-alanine ligase